MGLFDRFKKGLERTREKLATGLRSVLRIGQRIDEETLHRLEDVMLAADFGPTTTQKLIDVVRTGWKAGEIVWPTPKLLLEGEKPNQLGVYAYEGEVLLPVTVIGCWMGTGTTSSGLLM